MVETDILFDKCADGCPSLVDCNTSLFNDNITNSIFNYTLCLNTTDTLSTYEPSQAPKIEWQDPSYYSTPYRIIGTIFQGIILIVGKCIHIFLKASF